MARARLILDTRNGSKNVSDGSFPVVIKIFHKKPRTIRLSFSTSIAGWDEKNMIFKKSALANKNKDCDAIN
ncbi:MAG: hypothetical protein JJE07_10735, partial [Flavobacteriaceae bacterium]|nr:hypothetical protein [Flavobacteriaceae bacterium]